MRKKLYVYIFICLGRKPHYNIVILNQDTVGPIVVSFIDLSDQEETKIPDLPFSLQNIQDDSILKSSTIDQVLPKKLSTDSTKTMQFGAEEIVTLINIGFCIKNIYIFKTQIRTRFMLPRP